MSEDVLVSLNAKKVPIFTIFIEMASKQVRLQKRGNDDLDKITNQLIGLSNKMETMAKSVRSLQSKLLRMKRIRSLQTKLPRMKTIQILQKFHSSPIRRKYKKISMVPLGII